MVSKTRVTKRSSQFYVWKKNPVSADSQQSISRKTLLSKLEGRERKQVNKQIHNDRKQPKPKLPETRIEKSEHTALVEILCTPLKVPVDLKLSNGALRTGVKGSRISSIFRVQIDGAPQ